MQPETTRAAANPLRAGSYLTRKAATAALVEAGIPLSASSLDYMAARGAGPRYRIRNGRAVYARADLESWVSENASG